MPELHKLKAHIIYFIECNSFSIFTSIFSPQISLTSLSLLI
jgi:hypothetical protein